MVSRLLIGDNNLSKFWPAYQFSRPSLKLSTLVTATDLDALDSALTQVEEKDQVIVSVLGLLGFALPSRLARCLLRFSF